MTLFYTQTIGTPKGTFFQVGEDLEVLTPDYGVNSDGLLFWLFPRREHPNMELEKKWAGECMPFSPGDEQEYDHAVATLGKDVVDKHYSLFREIEVRVISFSKYGMRECEFNALLPERDLTPHSVREVVTARHKCKLNNIPHKGDKVKVFLDGKKLLQFIWQ